MAAASKANEPIIIPAIEREQVTLKIVGDSPLIMHKWSEKAKKEMRDKQMKVAKAKGKDAKDPNADFIESMYWLTEMPEDSSDEAIEAALEGARFGFPSVAFKASAVSGAYRAGVIKNKVNTNGHFHIQGDMVEIQGSKPVMREDMVRVGMGVADLRYRGEFKEWSAILPIVYSPGMITLENLVNLFNLGGFTCGIGEWRVEKGGSNGMYHVE